MKKVLIIGAGSYIGQSFESYAHGRIDICVVDARNDGWRDTDYSTFESVLYVAGIAHRKQTKKNEDLYFAVNRELAVSVAEKAKAEGARQFIYFSSIYAYGIKKGEITENTVPSPPEDDPYGLSKLQAEKLLVPMQSERFHVSVIRPPMVYGPGCRGNFSKLVKIAGVTPFIPTVDNKRSMIYIDNLCEFLAVVIEQNLSGVFRPQNKEYINTTDMMEKIRKAMGKKSLRLPLTNLFISGLASVSPALQSAFGSLYYSPDASRMPFEREYSLVGFEESIRKSIKDGYGS